MVAMRKWTASGVGDRLAYWREQVGDAAQQWSDREVETEAARLYERVTPLCEKERLLAALCAHAGPRAVLALRTYLADPDPGLEQLADAALADALARTPQGSGYDRNSPCPCGSGAKWKHCCAQEDDAWARHHDRGDPDAWR